MANKALEKAGPQVKAEIFAIVLQFPFILDTIYALLEPANSMLIKAAEKVI